MESHPFPRHFAPRAGETSTRPLDALESRSGGFLQATWFRKSRFKSIGVGDGSVFFWTCAPCSVYPITRAQWMMMVSYKGCVKRWHHVKKKRLMGHRKNQKMIYTPKYPPCLDTGITCQAFYRNIMKNGLLYLL